MMPPRCAARLACRADALVIGHVGNYVWHKNHDFLIEIAAEVLRREPRAWLLLVGHHLLGSPVEARVQRAWPRRAGW